MTDHPSLHAEAELCERLADELPRTFEERRTLQEEARRFIDKSSHDPRPRGRTAKIIPFPPRFQLDFSELPL